MKRRCAAFTLVELLTVIAIMSVLAAIIVPTTGKAIAKARRAKAASHLRQIAVAYASYAYDEGGVFRQIHADTLTEWAATLAGHTGLNDPQVWIVADDPQVAASRADKPRVIAIKVGNVWVPTDAFRNFPISFSVAAGVSVNAPASMTPIAWTRGLRSDGSWDEATGVYGSEGGHIAFLDGHVKWYQNLRDDGGQLINAQTGQPTANIVEALPLGAQVLE